ncbi:MAG: T9SS type A sorting domain-containing protein [Saprospiraceae bacterium]
MQAEKTLEIKSAVANEVIIPIVTIPNPTNGQVSFSGLPNDLVVDMEIYNQQSQMVHSLSKINLRHQHIDLSTSPNGLYLIKIRSQDKLYIGKIVKIDR